MTPLNRWLIGLIGTTFAVVVAYIWLDRPIALLLHHQVRQPGHGILEKLTHIPDPLIPLACVVFVVLGLRALLARTLSNHEAVAFICSESVIFSESIKDQLKIVFSRPWPETWVQDNPSFIRDGAYGFNWFHGGIAYQAFPSGHMAACCAVISVLWIWYPGLRALWVVGALAVAGGLIGANYHFLSDVIAGAFIGVSVGWMSAEIWKVSTGASEKSRMNKK